MTLLQKCKLIACLMFAVISGIEIMLFCSVFHAGLTTPYTLFSIVTFVILFNASIWWFRTIYGRVKRFHTQEEYNEQNTG